MLFECICLNIENINIHIKKKLKSKCPYNESQNTLFIKIWINSFSNCFQLFQDNQGMIIVTLSIVAWHYNDSKKREMNTFSFYTMLTQFVLYYFHSIFYKVFLHCKSFFFLFYMYVPFYLRAMQIDNLIFHNSWLLV